MSNKNQKARLTCGLCSGLDRDRLKDNKLKCSGLGMLPLSKACALFKPDVFSLDKVCSSIDELYDPIADIASCIENLRASEKEVFGEMLLNDRITEKYGYKFWQKVFVRIGGMGNYKSNFVAARILDVDKDFIRMLSESCKTCIQYRNSLVKHGYKTASIYSVQEFELVRNEMTMDKRYIDPVLPRATKKLMNKSKIYENLDFAKNNGLIASEFGEDEGVNKRYKRNLKVRISKDVSMINLLRKLLNTSVDEPVEQLVNLANCIHELNPVEKGIFGAALLKERRTEKYGYKFWQRVQVNIGYLVMATLTSSKNPYAAFRILDVDKDWLRMVSEKGSICYQSENSAAMYGVKNSVLTFQEYEVLRKDPKFIALIVENSKKVEKKSKVFDTLDLARNVERIPEELNEDEPNTEGGKKKRTVKNKYTELIRKMNSGIISEKPDKEYDYDNGDISINHF